jgi:hypothetical protein
LKSWKKIALPRTGAYQVTPMTHGNFMGEGGGGRYTLLGRRTCSDFVAVNAAAGVIESDVAVITRRSNKVNAS